jgi:transposase-like protein
VKKGLQRNEDGEGNPKVTQRFLCKDCDRTFNKRTNGVLSQSKLKAWQWVRFVELMLRKASLAKCELECHVSAPTAHYMRMRICQVMAKVVPAFTCKRRAIASRSTART